ncbi:MAG: hypothetical protein MR531_13230 [Lachnospiraceae bacterium]|nr:hypothetical protein [Lachnospiraceae bacterium]
MDYDYNRILFENRQITNKSALLWMELMAGMTGLIWLLGLLHVISTITWVFYILMPVSILLLLLPAVLNKVFKLSDSITMDAQKIKLLTISILGCSLSSVFLLSVALSPYVAIAWLFPMMIACQYYSRRITSATFLAGLFGIITSYFLSLLVGAWDYNMIAPPALDVVRNLTLPIAGYASLYLFPRILLYCAGFPLFVAITKRTSLLLKKQKLAIMAFQAKQTFDEMQEFPDTFITDCKIKMRYLAKNDIDVDTALKNMNGNVDKYNEFMLTFVGESHRKEDELFNLMTPDSLLQYGSKAHALRVKANALGLKNLTDTAFFHEMEAYAGNLEVVQANWEKLSFELDEACDIFTDYIQSLGLKNHATDQNGNQITFKKWGEQLQEAFQALEAYDATRARNILNELLQYQIDADITKNLQSIVTNIDELLEA